MIAEVAAHVPPSLGAYRDGVAVGPGGTAALPLASLHDPAVFDGAITAFAAGYGGADRRAVVSYWSQHYLAALATPALTALMRLGRPLPLAFAATSLELDEGGRPARLLIRDGGACGGAACPAGLAGLVEGHLRPFVALCHARCGLAPRVLWGNAATILGHVARELGGDAPACEEVAACLGWRGGAACATTPLAQALRPDASGGPRRRACCLRHRLPGVPSCGALCPLERCAPPC
ncbi:siderophore-iron reductase FhuF [Methylobacterium sp. J-076]|uniref:siderophore-iron reductase FhuF n=1 Tax=Methylobacterium sp. J-076 TaxID=2836655 RepID=UPI001FB86F4B|nr:siderophore-iron reductase FhuF [Methylobacterium sp. J-076]MCJ2012265.1 siderophore-iron reductase FhuF [Methylobacterium sp. J-076]